MPSRNSLRLRIFCGGVPSGRGERGGCGPSPGRTAVQDLVRYIVCSKLFSRTSFCQKLCAELLCRSLQMCKAGIVAQHIVCLRGEGAFRCLGVQAAGGHLGEMRPGPRCGPHWSQTVP